MSDVSIAQTSEPVSQRHLQLWPGIAAVTLQWLVRYALPIVAPDALVYAVIGGLVGGLAIAIWWTFFSRAPQLERWIAVVLIAVALIATKPFVHVSIATGMMGMMLFIYAIPVLSLALVAWAAASQRLADAPRRATMVAAILLACGVWTLVRTNGLTGDAVSDFAWRWSETSEVRLLARSIDKLETPPVAPLPAVTKTPEKQIAAPVATLLKEPEPAPVATPLGGDWPGFRGPHRNGILPGVRIETDWAASPPVEMWRAPIGPGWSSFAVHGDRFYTQEQRGEEELVSCYNLTTGKPVWRHSDTARFWESNAGAGPRATPTLSAGRVYTFGATGIVNALDARNGAVVWSRNTKSDTGVKTPGWGFASSPLVVDDIVIVAAGGKLIGYDLATGIQRWLGPDGGGGGYSSPHRMILDGVSQIILMSGSGATSVAAADGKRLWEYALPGNGIGQPALTAGGDILFGEGDGNNMHRIAVRRGLAGWAVEDRWSSNGLKPYFNDFVVHKDHAYGFDGGILSCIDVMDGKRKWKGGRYGHGQLLLLADQDLLLVLSEEGELALVAAAPGEFKELARFPAIQGKTWNHPVLAGGVLLVRNGEEMAGFRLTLARR